MPNAVEITAYVSYLRPRYGIAWGVVGLAMECYSTALNYSLSRIQLANRLQDFENTHGKNLHTWLQKLPKRSCLIISLPNFKDSGKMRPQQVSMAKRNN